MSIACRKTTWTEESSPRQFVSNQVYSSLHLTFGCFDKYCMQGNHPNWGLMSMAVCIRLLEALKDKQCLQENKVNWRIRSSTVCIQLLEVLVSTACRKTTWTDASSLRQFASNSWKLWSILPAGKQCELKNQIYSSLHLTLQALIRIACELKNQVWGSLHPTFGGSDEYCQQKKHVNWGIKSTAVCI